MAPSFLPEPLDDGRHQRRSRLLGEEQAFCFRHTWFEMSIGQPSRNVQYKLGKHA